MRVRALAWLLILLLARETHALPASAADGFALVAKGKAATFVCAPGTDVAVVRAIEDLRGDVERVTGVRPPLRSTVEPAGGEEGPVVIVGVVGQSAWLDRLREARKLDLAAIDGQWESYVITVVAQPCPGVDEALVIAGSDRRGAVYGCYEISEMIGVSPWYWWADVTPAHRDALSIDRAVRRFGPPSVAYRGIFINDEDWGLQPWAAQTFEPEHGGIGPKTYAKVFELLLRLKANTLWPAMHACTKPFNAFPESARLADAYGIVMGSSHAEPMLRNNVGEWTDDHERYNYVTNRDGVRAYWEQRMKENAAYENLFTLGMRGIHDSGIQGATSDAQRIKVLEQVFADQRELIARYARPAAAARAAGGSDRVTPARAAPQIFCAYKEVLDLYRKGLQVPDDVTIVWPDDNFGYIRNYASPAERRRAGGFGVYYHLSYLGAPLSYLWLCTTPPALVWEEMTKAYAHGAQTLWIVNVGDIKPAEMQMEYFLRLAWDVHHWDDQPLGYLSEWAAREFGSAVAPELSSIFREYYRLNYERKPEHLQWWRRGEPPRPSPLTTEEILARLSAFSALRERVERLEGRIAPERRDAFFEMVAYPVSGAGWANERYFAGELAARGSTALGGPQEWLNRANRADEALKRLTRRYNTEVAGGKWDRLMTLEPADGDWPMFRLEPWRLPRFAGSGSAVTTRSSRPRLMIEAEAFDQKVDQAGAGWRLVPGLGRTGPGAVTIEPPTWTGAAIADGTTRAPRLVYRLELPRAGTYRLIVNLIPTQPLIAGRGLRLGVGLDDGAPREVIAKVKDGSPEWEQSVLDNTVAVTVSLGVADAGPHELCLYGQDAGVVVDRLVIEGE